MHMSQASPPNATVPFTQYSVAHCDWHIPFGPHVHAVMSLTRIPMPAVCASWQQVAHCIAVDIAVHIWSFCVAFPLLLPEGLPPPEPLALLEVPPLAILPLVHTSADRARRVRHRRYVLAGAVGAFALALVLTHLFYRPLDLLWDAALHRLSG